MKDEASRRLGPRSIEIGDETFEPAFVNVGGYVYFAQGADGGLTVLTHDAARKLAETILVRLPTTGQPS